MFSCFALGIHGTLDQSFPSLSLHCKCNEDLEKKNQKNNNYIEKMYPYHCFAMNMNQSL